MSLEMCFFSCYCSYFLQSKVCNANCNKEGRKYCVSAKNIYTQISQGPLKQDFERVCLFLFCFVLFLVGGVGSSLVGLDDLDQNIELIIWNVKTSEILSVPESFVKISGKDLAHTNCHLQSWCRRSAPWLASRQCERGKLWMPWMQMSIGQCWTLLGAR